MQKNHSQNATPRTTETFLWRVFGAAAGKGKPHPKTKFKYYALDIQLAPEVWCFRYIFGGPNTYQNTF